MFRSGSAALAVVVFMLLAGCGKGSDFTADIDAIGFETTTVPPADAGRLYNTVVAFTTSGNASLPDRFEITQGVLPPGISLERDREDLNFDGLPDVDGAFTGSARLLGTPRQQGSFQFRLKAISTGALAGLAQGGGQPALAAEEEFTINVGEGTVAILNPTAAEGTKDPQVPAFPDVIPFVNPANPKAFFSFSFLVAGGSGNNKMSIFAPRELELSVFDQAVQTSPTPVTALRNDTDESVTGASTSPYQNDISDGGWFLLQGGTKQIQVGGFQSPRGAIRVDTDDDGVQDTDFMLTLLDQWFQDPACPLNARRDFGDTLGLGGGDATLGAASAILFCDYFDPAYRDTDGTVADADRAKYGFKKDQYVNAFFVAFGPGDLTPLKYNVIVQAVDTRGTLDKTDDVIARKNYLVQIQIPDIVIDTVFLVGGQAGVDYNEFVNASGGVPPLSFDLEWVDSASDLVATFGDPLDKGLFGLELEPSTGQFLGAPRAAAPDTDPSTATADGPVVELTVRVFAAVMNPTQNGPVQVPTGTAGEFDGTGPDPDGPGPLTGKPGRHKTFPVNFELPSVPVVANASLVPGIDGIAYPGDRVTGSGGVPLLAPYPVGFFVTSPGGTYPSATARRAYDWDSEYVLDGSHPDPTLMLGNAGDTVNGLPHNLSLVKSASLATNGNITGNPLDRGFHPVTMMGLDFYVGNIAAAAADGTAFRTPFQKTLALSISPDSALYMRGVQTSEASGGEPTGLLDATNQMAEPRMAPMLLAAGIYSVETGKAAQLFNTAIPKQIDLLPVMIPNGGTDTHNNKAGPSVSGYWPAEHDNEIRWYYFGDQAWKHVQQENCWIQAPDADHSRVFMWAETDVKTFNSGAWTHTYQQLNLNGKRGPLVVKPLTGEFFVAAVLDGTVDSHGKTFGAEAVVSSGSTSATGSVPGYDRPMYMQFYYYGVRDSAYKREIHLHGTSAYIEAYGTSRNTSNGWYKNSAGRTATSVAMSADGIWCATALPGGANTQKLLFWRTDKQPVSDFWAAAGHITFIDGQDSDGTALVNYAAIYRPAEAAVAAGIPMGTNQRYLLPDSLMFVENGLLFLNETNLDRVYGISLEDGHISSKALNGVGRNQVNGAGTGPTVWFDYGQFVPDQDYLRGMGANQGFAVQFSFTGDKPDADEEGPDKVAFVGGDNVFVGALTDLGSSHPREGYAVHSNRAKSLLFLDLNTTTGGLDLGASTLRDLTGSDSDIYGDLLTPGRFGEEQDWLVLSDDGAYAGLVREILLEERSIGTFGYRAAFHSPFYYRPSTSSSYTGWAAAHDLLILSTTGAQMSSTTGQTGAHILFMGTGTQMAVGAGDPAGMPAYAHGENHLNASYRRVNGLTFAPDGRTIVFNYAGHDQYTPNYTGNTSTGWGPINPETTGTFDFGRQMSVRLHFRTAAPALGPIDFADASNVKNNLQGLTGIGNIGPTSAPFGEVSSVQLFWATFKSTDGNFLYYISDQISSSSGPSATNRNFMVGFNISGGTINGRDPFVPFIPHPATIGFEQFDVNSWNYEHRFASSPPGVAFGGRDASGILCVIASDASPGPGSSTDLEVYVMDANRGTDLIAVTSSITTGNNNAINHLRLSSDGNVLAGHRTATATGTVSSRAHLNGDSDLFAVTNLHAVLGGATPTTFLVSQGMSHGSSVAFVGEGTVAGPQAIIFSAGSAGGNDSWDDRTLRSAVLASGGGSVVLDNTLSHYFVLAGGRKLDDVATTSD